MEKNKTIQISDSVHSKLKSFSKKNGIKINDWTSILLSEILPLMENYNATNLSDLLKKIQQ